MKILNIITEYEDPDNLFTIQEQIDQCCEEVKVDICADVGKEEIFFAKGDDDAWEDTIGKLKNKYNDDPKFTGKVVVINEGSNHPCGNKYTEWRESKNCCLDVELLEEDTDYNAEVMADYSSTKLAIVGGQPPYTWFTLDPGLYFKEPEETRRSITYNKSKTLYSNDICGTVSIAIIDNCEQLVTISLRAVDGEWVKINQPAGVTCLGDYDCSDPYNYKRYCSAISGAYKHRQEDWSELLYYRVTVHEDDPCPPPLSEEEAPPGSEFPGTANCSSNVMCNPREPRFLDRVGTTLPGEYETCRYVMYCNDDDDWWEWRC